MTRRKYLLTKYLRTGLGTSTFDEMADDILRIVNARELMSLKDVSVVVCRPRTTVGSWVERKHHAFPVALGTTSGGQIWDGEAIRAWAEKNPELCGERPGDVIKNG